MRGIPLWSLSGEANTWNGKSTFKFDSQGRINTHIIDDKTFATWWRNVSLWNYLTELLPPAPEPVWPACPEFALRGRRESSVIANHGCSSQVSHDLCFQLFWRSRKQCDNALRGISGCACLWG